MRTLEDQRKDEVSHHTLRLAFCRNLDDRRFFTANEATLLRWRLRQKNTTELNDLLHNNNFSYDTMTPDEWQQHSAELELLHPHLQQQARRASNFFRVPWEHAFSLVARRAVYLFGGVAYCFRDDLLEIVISRFRGQLSDALQVATRCQSAVRDDQRVSQLVDVLTRPYQDMAQYKLSSRSGAVSLSDIDSLAARSFPPCMRNLHVHLRSNHHLKHGGRMQYGLFLKGIGLSMQDALAFWRSEFAQKVGVDKFDKTYAYNIRHNYGQEGKRVDYTPYSCAKIIRGDPPGADDHHGCPFKHFDAVRLHSTMSAAGVTETQIREIQQLLQPINGGPHYHVACRKCVGDRELPVLLLLLLSSSPSSSS